MTTVQPNVETLLIKGALASMNIFEEVLDKKLGGGFEDLVDGLKRMLWLREKGASHLFVTERDGVFRISDPAEEALFKIGEP